MNKRQERTVEIGDPDPEPPAHVEGCLCHEKPLNPYLRKEQWRENEKACSGILTGHEHPYADPECLASKPDPEMPVSKVAGPPPVQPGKKDPPERY